MPRIFTSANDPLDFCLTCFPSEQDALIEFGNVGNGPDGRGNCFAYNAEHPDYDGEDYECFFCSEPLISEDN
jgi:hypothetical protein